MTGNPLHEVLLQRIRSGGPITFAEFMECALYHPDHGYYQKNVSIGKRGDFFTSPHVTPLFGRLVGKQLEEMWEVLGRPAAFHAVEMGAGHGFLAADILDDHGFSAGFRSALRYTIVESSRKLRAEQEQRIGARAAWAESLRDFHGKGLEGCIFSNEFVDSLPVHRVTLRNGSLMEIRVGERNGELVEVLWEPQDQRILDYFGRLKIDLPEGIRTEVNLGMLSWLADVAHGLSRGFLLTIDYGMSARELFSDLRMEGTLRCYRAHRIETSLLDSPGEKDMTSHVDFSTLALRGKEVGLETLGFTDQTHFLMGIGEAEITEALRKEAGSDLGAVRRRAAILSLLHPETMGACFRVLVQEKGVGAVRLSGLKNARGRLF